MLFNSVSFFIFFPAVVLIYFLLPDKIKQYWLLVASYYFYMSWNAKYGLLILTSTVITYFCGRAIGATGQKNKKKLAIWLGLLSNLGILAYFKYTNFAIESVNSVFSLNIPARDIVLPVGISFYTFQALGYIIDVYRGDVKPQRNFFKYALFVSFFPQLVAGPIERSGNLMGQLEEPKHFSYENFRQGMLLMIWGYFLKLVIADRAGIFVDEVYGNMGDYPGAYLVVATLLFTIQLYCDFYGYSTIAVGAAKVLGIDLMENFNAPLLSTSIAEMWRNWHISLTSWFTDYIYIPLGGNRKGKLRKYFNIMIVFLVSGLWHGANWTFVIWGGLNGLYQIIGDALKPLRKGLVKVLSIDLKSTGSRAIHIAVTFLLYAFSLIFFRAQTVSQAFAVIRSILTVRNPWTLFDGSLYNCGLDEMNFVLLMICIVVLWLADLAKRKKIRLREVVLAQDVWCRILIISLAIVFIATVGIWGKSYDAAGFIYFQF